MTELDTLKTILNISGNESDTVLNALLTISEDEIIKWVYRNVELPDEPELPTKYANTKIQAVVVGYSMMGAEGQTASVENEISRTFKYTEMLDYIHKNVIPYARLV